MSEAKYVSGIMLERIFFRAFFNEIARRGVTRIKHRKGSDEENIRFHHAYEVFVKLNLASDELKRLKERLRCNPMSGRYSAFWENLIAIHPARVDQKYVYLYPQREKRQKIEWLPQDLISQMAQAYVGGGEYLTPLREVLRNIDPLCPRCKGKTGRKCDICDGTGKIKIKPRKSK